MIAQSSSLAVMAGMIAALCVTPATAAVTISTDATANMNCVSGVCTPTARKAVLNVGDLTTMLGSGNVVVNTGSGLLAQQVNDIVVSASFNWANASSLTLDAYESLTVNQPVAVNGTGAVVLTTNDGGKGGNLSFPSGGDLSFLGTANNLTINGAAYTLENSVATLASATSANPQGAFALANSYDASRDGTYSNSPIPSADGKIEGLGNIISNLTVILPGKSKYSTSLGLIGSFGGSLSSLNLSNIEFSVHGGYSTVGGLVGSNSGLLFDDHTSGSISNISRRKNEQIGLGPTGGLAGFNQGTIQSSSSSVRVIGYTAGGLVGVNEEGYVALSHATGDVSGSYRPGTNLDLVSVGGLIGLNNYNSMVTQSYATGGVRSGGFTAGGLVGYNEFDDEETSTISNCYATGKVKEADYVGGLSGFSGDEFQPSIVEYSYSTGAVADGTNVGGLLGGYATTMTSNYWDTNTSKTTNGVDGGNTPGITGLTTQQLQSGLPAGFDPTIWAESPSINHGFPYLIANPPQ